PGRRSESIQRAQRQEHGARGADLELFDFGTHSETALEVVARASSQGQVVAAAFRREPADPASIGSARLPGEDPSLAKEDGVSQRKGADRGEIPSACLYLPIRHGRATEGALILCLAEIDVRRLHGEIAQDLIAAEDLESG